MKKAIWAGIFLSLGGYASISLPHPIKGFVFSFGLLFILILNLNLFTGKLLILQDGISLKKIWRLIVFYIGNFIGCVLCGWIFRFLNTQTIEKNIDFIPLLLNGIFCNFLVCLAVYGFKHSNNIVSKFISVCFPITIFITCGFEHSIAEMFYITFFHLPKFDILIPVTIGNIIGAYVFMVLSKEVENGFNN